MEQTSLTKCHSCQLGTYSHVNCRFPIHLFTYACGDYYVFCCMWNRLQSRFIIIHTQVLMKNKIMKKKEGKEKEKKIKEGKDFIYSQSYFLEHTQTKAYFLNSCKTKCLKISLWIGECSYFVWGSASRKAVSCCEEEGRQRANCIQQLQVLQHCDHTWLCWPPIKRLQLIGFAKEAPSSNICSAKKLFVFSSRQATFHKCFANR